MYSDIINNKPIHHYQNILHRKGRYNQYSIYLFYLLNLCYIQYTQIILINISDNFMSIICILNLQYQHNQEDKHIHLQINPISSNLMVYMIDNFVLMLYIFCIIHHIIHKIQTHYQNNHPHKSKNMSPNQIFYWYFQDKNNIHQLNFNKLSKNSHITSICLNHRQNNQIYIHIYSLPHPIT